MAERPSPRLYSVDYLPDGPVRFYADGYKPPRHYVMATVEPGTEGGYDVSILGLLTPAMLEIDRRSMRSEGPMSAEETARYRAEQATLPVIIGDMEVSIKPGARAGDEERVALLLVRTVIELAQ